MLTKDAIYSSQDIRLYSDELISVKSSEDNEIYWFSKRGLPWGSRENSSFLRHRNCDPEQYTALTSIQAISLIDCWKSSRDNKISRNAEISELE